MFISIADFPSL